MRVRQLGSVFATLFLCLIVLALCTAPMWAQSTSTGTIAGTVTDPSGAVVNGATVTLTDTATKSARQASTNDAGRYIFVDVPPGAYDLTIAKQGFSTTKTQTTVTVGVTLTLNMALQIGGSNVVVEVTAVGTELQTMNATVGNTVTSIALDNLPTIGRDVNTFIELQPGVSAGGDVAGAVNDQSYFSLDGGNNSNDMDGSGSEYTPRSQQNLVIGDPTGGIATQSFTYSAAVRRDADSGRQRRGVQGKYCWPDGGFQQFSRRRNQGRYQARHQSFPWHRLRILQRQQLVVELLAEQPKQLATRSVILAFRPTITAGLAALSEGHSFRKRFSVARPFFFFNYEGFRYPNSETITRNVPSPALQLGLLTDSANGQIAYNLNNVPVTYKGITYAANSGTGGAYTCGGPCDPLNLGLNPLVSQIWSKYAPASNATCSLSLCDNANVLGFAGNLNIPITSKFMVGRIDHDFSSKQHFMASYRYYNQQAAADDQVDIGGFFTGDTKGTPASLPRAIPFKTGTLSRG